MLMLDHTPTAQGRPGQIIAFTHDPDSIDYVCVDFPTLLAQTLEQIEEDPEDFLEG